jgi:hypothetical protein
MEDERNCRYDEQRREGEALADNPVEREQAVFTAVLFRQLSFRTKRFPYQYGS